MTLAVAGASPAICDNSALTAAAIFGLTPISAGLALGLAGIGPHALFAHALSRRVLGQPFILAARALGVRPMRLVFRHLLPNAMTPIIIAATLRVGSTILTEATLSFLGLGVQPPTPSWGNIVFDNKNEIFTSWWIPLASGGAIAVTVIGYNLLGDGLRDALDPRLRQ